MSARVRRGSPSTRSWRVSTPNASPHLPQRAPRPVPLPPATRSRWAGAPERARAPVVPGRAGWWAPCLAAPLRPSSTSSSRVCGKRRRPTRARTRRPPCRSPPSRARYDPSSCRSSCPKLPRRPPRPPRRRPPRPTLQPRPNRLRRPRRRRRPRRPLQPVTMWSRARLLRRSATACAASRRRAHGAPRWASTGTLAWLGA